VRHVACEVCGADDAQTYASRTPRSDVLHTRLVRCNRCGFVFANPRAEADEAQRFYESVEHRGSGSLGADVDTDAWRAVVSARRAHLRPVEVPVGGAPAAYLEIGFGDGSGLAAAAELGWKPTGVEYAQWLVDAARIRVPEANVLLGDVGDVQASPESFDVVYAWHVIEHVLDVREWLGTIARLLKPGGTLIIGTESSESLYGRIWTSPSRLTGRTPTPPTSTDHSYWFSARALRALLEEQGFAVSELRVYENGPLEIMRGQTMLGLRNPRWLAVLVLYLLTSCVSMFAPRLGGKLYVRATRPGRA
jgi:2-polyprenyl-3-methyl-5-hydroxy-6-metoxy-1,4-benzoquinol methylase